MVQQKTATPDKLGYVNKMQWLMCKITGGGTLHSGLGHRQWSCAFP